MMLNSLLDQEEIDRECKVIQEEIKRGEDEPSDQVHDLHIQARWSGHALGKPIIGTRDSVASFKRDDFVTYMKRRYCGENVVLGIAGMMDVDRIISKTTELFAKIPAGAGDTQLPAIKPVVTHQEITKDTEQVHFCIGTDSFKVTDETVYTVALIDNILGSGMSSRLFQEVRERRGLAYSIGSYSLSYSAGGLFTIYGGTGIQYWDEVKTVVRTELDKIMQELVSPAELERTRGHEFPNDPNRSKRAEPRAIYPDRRNA
jgi:predicted Zn-dependent peptidase